MTEPSRGGGWRDLALIGAMLVTVTLVAVGLVSM